MRDIRPDDTIVADTVVVLTSGSYSDYRIWGIFRAKTDTVVPWEMSRWDPHTKTINLSALSILLEELDYVEGWSNG